MSVKSCLKKHTNKNLKVRFSDTNMVNFFDYDSVKIDKSNSFVYLNKTKSTEEVLQFKIDLQ